MEEELTMKEELLKILEDINDDIVGYEGDNLFDDDILDSLSVIDLVAELEDHFGIEIDPKYIVEENFSSVDAILALIESLKKN